MAKADFLEAYRTVFLNEMKHLGFTWPPMYKPNHLTTHHNRIDFVYFKCKGVKIDSLKTVGENKKNADIVAVLCPSDHRSIVATFTRQD